MSQIWTFLLENGAESISNDSKIIPESFPSNFHVIFTLRSPQTINFQLKLHKKLKSKPELCQDIDDNDDDDDDEDVDQDGDNIHFQ